MVAELIDVSVPVDVADDVESWDEVGVEVAEVVADEVWVTVLVIVCVV